MLTVRIDAPAGTVAYPDFHRGVKAQLDGARDVEAVLGDSRRPLLTWYVEDLSRNGAFEVALTGRPRAAAPRRLPPDFADQVTRGYVDQVNVATETGAVPPMLSMATVERLEAVAAILTTGEARGLVTEDRSTGRAARLDAKTRTALRELITPAWQSVGSVTGRLDTIGRRPRPYATVYDERTGRGVRCEFPDPDRLLQQVLDSFGRRVIAEGVVYYNRDNKITRLVTGDLQVLPNDADLPRADQLRGRFPGLSAAPALLADAASD